MILINLRATLKKLHKNSETYTQHNYLFKTVFLVLVKFICTQICYTSTSLFFSFHLSGPLNNNKALYMKIAVCINTLPQQCSSDLKKFFIPNTKQKHDVIDHISTKYRKCCKCCILYTRLKN